MVDERRLAGLAGMVFAGRVDSHRSEEGRLRGLRGLLRWLVFFAVCVGLGMRSGAAGVRPNIVLILADDLGVHDLGCYGAASRSDWCLCCRNR